MDAVQRKQRKHNVPFIFFVKLQHQSIQNKPVTISNDNIEIKTNCKVSMSQKMIIKWQHRNQIKLGALGGFYTAKSGITELVNKQ